MTLHFILPARKIALVLLSIMVGITVVGMADLLYRYQGNPSARFLELTQVFVIGDEMSIQNWYSTCLLLMCSVLLALIATIRRVTDGHYYWHWAGLSILYLGLSIEEVTDLHGQLTPTLRQAFRASGPFFFAWVIPAAVFVLILAVIYLRFLIALPTATRVLFVTAGIIIVSGAIGLEMIGAYLVSSSSPNPSDKMTLPVALESLVEETLETSSTLLFMYALLAYIGDHIKEVRIKISSRTSGSSR
jgi:hypothetical protein